MYKILLIEDDDSLRSAMRELLVMNGYCYVGAADGEEGLRLLRQEDPDLLLLDVMLPGVNGFELCQKIRDLGETLPIIFVSAKDDIVDKSMGFRAGGDDYVTKPFNSQELLLRIEANIRRSKEMTAAPVEAERPSVTRIGDLEIRFDEYQVLVDGVPAGLTTKEFEIVAFLALNPGKVYTRQQIQEYIWGEADYRDSNLITVFVRKIREKIEKNPSEPKHLITVHRVGYKMADNS